MRTFMKLAAKMPSHHPDKWVRADMTGILGRGRYRDAGGVRLHVNLSPARVDERPPALDGWTQLVREVQA